MRKTNLERDKFVNYLVEDIHLLLISSLEEEAVEEEYISLARYIINNNLNHILEAICYAKEARKARLEDNDIEDI